MQSLYFDGVDKFKNFWYYIYIRRNIMPELFENEKIKQIENFPDYYITTFGRVWSEKTHRWLKPTDNSRGNYHRLYVSLGRGNKRYIHRLVAEAFIPKIEGCEEIDHIDANGLNNYVDNLRWVTHDQNMQNEITKDRVKTNKGGKVEILDTLTGEIYLGYDAAALAANVSPFTIKNHTNGHLKKMKPRWVFANGGKRIFDK